MRRRPAVAGPPETTDAPRVLSALRPKMHELAAGILGAGAMLAPAIKVVLSQIMTTRLGFARHSLKPSLRLPTYATSLLKFGFADEDLAGGLSDRLVEALVAIGDVDAVVRRVEGHLSAEADQVCVEVLTGDDTTVPVDASRR